ncbi:pilus assembly protein TadG-related protein [Pseudemcibacter aquimaris]|uniref:pilus assembly protein TadG-related protein n=1 Tax=Pseudemcibacter aquimaris TaxID=2857064 RepID=UPI0020130F7B|nr:pilus assembly protein TadG-related protein [Pseudemcibacter aquimaris]MCC3859718.1 pilus assembly protein TadG-related protein [Pseudemcibacter aquimaris]WDU60113.1 hypothetical protein KW060_07560 [Pseudemcibacter aquimaris]
MTSLLRKLKEQEDGAILIQTVFLMLVFIGILGAGVDIGRAFLYKSRLSGALDAAALAGSKAFTSKTRDAQIQAFFDSNFDSDFMGGSVGPLNIKVVDAANKSLSVSTTGNIDTYFFTLFGITDFQLPAEAETTSRQSGLQLAMVLDVTGSMGNSDGGIQRINALKTSANSLVDALFGDEASNDNLEISVVPYVTSVNVGHLLDSSYIDRSEMPDSYTISATDKSKWYGCVEARSTNSNLTASNAYDVIPDHDGEDWTPYLWRPGYDNHFYSLTDLKGPNKEDWGAPDYEYKGMYQSTNDAGPNIACPPPVLDFTTSKATLNSYINSLYYAYGRGGTVANLGMIWGWRMLHTGAPFNNDVDYNDTNMPKALILMTDGENWVINSKNYSYYYGYDAHPYYDGVDDYYDNNDAYDDNGNGKCPNCTGTFVNKKGKTKKKKAEYDQKDETKGPQQWDKKNGDNIGEYYRGDYSGYGRRDEGRLDGATTQTASTAAIDKRLAHVCAVMKSDPYNIIVYTITFGSGTTNNAALRALYQNCASDSAKYFHAPTASELDGAFEAIANDLSDLRLSK